MIKVNTVLALTFSLELCLYFTFHIYGVSISFPRLFGFLIFIICIAVILSSYTFTNFTADYIKKWIFFLYYIFFVSLLNILINYFFETLIPDFLFYFSKGFFVLIFQLLLYIYLPLIIIKTNKSFCSFLNIFRVIGGLSIIFGIFDYLSQIFFNYDLIGRHFYDPIDVGKRFHGLFGEPRDAGVILIFLVFIESLYAHIKINFIPGNRLNNKKIIFRYKLISLIYFFLSLLAQSLSTFLGLALGILFYFLLVEKKNFKFLVKYLFIILLITIIFIFLVSTQDRIALYYDSFLSMNKFLILKDFDKIPGVYRSQLTNIIPIYEFIERLSPKEIFYFLFGGGYSSSPILLKEIFYFDEYNYPASHVSRWLTDIGLFGTIFYFILIYIPGLKFINNLSSTLMNKQVLFWYILFSSLAITHRSYALFMGISMLIIVLNINSKNKS